MKKEIKKYLDKVYLNEETKIDDIINNLTKIKFKYESEYLRIVVESCVSEVYNNCDDYNVYFQVCGYQLETDEQEKARERNQEKDAIRKKEREYLEYQRLKTLFENK